MSIKESATVLVVDGPYEGASGRVCRVYHFSDSAVVAFDNGEVAKVRMCDMVEVAPQQRAESRERCKPIERSEVTITPAEFLRISTQTALKECDGNMIIGLSFARFASKLHEALFMVEADNA